MMESLDTTDTSVSNQSGNIKKIILGLVALGLVSLVCLGVVAYFFFDQLWERVNSVTEFTAASGEQPVSNQIAIVGNDDNIWLISPDSEEMRQITTDGRGYRFPTWAPDGRYLAFVGPDEANTTTLYVTAASKNEPMPLFNEANSAPFYLYWSPDSHLITFLTQERVGLAMREADAIAGTTRLLAEGSPFYWVWSPAGDKLLMHVGGARTLSEKAHLSILENQEDAERVELNLAPGNFQAPLWSTDGKFFYYIASDDQGRESIYRTEANTLEQNRVTNLAGFAYMVLSPTGEHIAYMQIEQSRPPFGTAYIVDTDGQNHMRLTDDPVGSMYWSPDGTKLALLTISRQQDGGSTANNGILASPLPQEVVFRWMIYHVETDELEPLVSFDPTVDFLQLIPFFDQYHLSLTFWSPDSRYLVISKENAGETTGTIWVVDTTGEEEPRQVAEGTLAIWSWQ